MPHPCLKRACRFALISTVLFAANVGASDPPVVNAAREQRWVDVAELVSQGEDVKVAQPDGTTALHWAAYHGDTEAAELLLGAGADPGTANDYGATAVSLAARNGSATMLKVLLESGADPNQANPTGETVLMTAALTGRTAAVDLLLNAGADPGARETSHGQSALMWAVSEGHLETARTLIDHGADVHAATSSGFTPVMFAARRGDVNLARLLLSTGARVNDTSEDGTSVLHVATVRGHVDLALYLLDEGANPNADGPGYAPLHWASGIWESAMTYDYPVETGEWSRLGGVGERRLELMSALLDRGADPNARITGRPPRFGNSYGTPGKAGGTPLFLAAQAHDIDAMKILVERGADPTQTADQDITPLMAAAMMNRESGSSHLDEAGGIDAIRLCLELGNDVNSANAVGDTALHAAALYGSVGMTEFLLENGADPSPVNAKGQTPLRNAIGVIQNAMLKEQPEVAAVLRRYGAVAPEVELGCGVCPPPPPADLPEDDSGGADPDEDEPGRQR